ncbi:tRNA (guanine(9)-N(1))-methyltransferase [Conoideocrella luteorostrata]|uniref:tRNA (guanine(9)-N1)-methyltransferase n=1 Tax=Conoideocrella luteorostrata TaxID=1105319 RepID=A0AAJ0CJI6_9HYPO|nr:tRNA (guanine(9)-N(1))-methyltransferase [Conoideocrella luteorostrata]
MSSAAAEEAVAAASAVIPSNTTPDAEPNKLEDASSTVQGSTATEPQQPQAAPKMSKNAFKRLRRLQEWEDGREHRKIRRREKRVATKARRREERAMLLAHGADPAVLFAKKTPAQLVPVSLILDCGFEEYMTDKERVSLSNQVTRCYSDNRNFKYKSHFWISGWGGKLKERFETAMESQHSHWTGVGFEQGDFLAAALRARRAMATSEAGEMVGSLRRSRDGGGIMWEKDETEPFPLPDPLPKLNEEYKDVVYLTSESPYTLERLEPHTSYIIGGLVDKNREKGLCYRRAVERGIRTAKLPIGQYLVMQSRQILATNHVVEIMVRWLECEDWGEAFLQVIPKRKGGKLIEGMGIEAEGKSGNNADGGGSNSDSEANEEDDVPGQTGDDGEAHKHEMNNKE